MITGSTNKFLVKQIALLFCKNDLLCKSALESRVNNYITDSIFETLVLPNLNSKRLYLSVITGAKYHDLKYDLSFKVKDLITGNEGTGVIKDVPIDKAKDLNFVYGKIGRSYHGEIKTPEGMRSITLYPVAGGYGITVVTPTVNPENNEVNPPLIVPIKYPTSGNGTGAVPSVPGNVEPAMSDWLIYAALGLGLYLVLK